MSIDSYPLEQPQPDYMIVTSTTRPTNPYKGLHIWETDTERLMYWQGTNWVQVVNFKMHGVGAGLAGPALPPVDTGSIPFKLQCGTAVLASSAGGDSTIVLPVAFPNGLIYASALQGDNTHAGATWTTHSYSVTQFLIRMYTSSGSVWANSGNFRVNWLAIGW
jgi:hypothetical protein